MVQSFEFGLWFSTCLSEGQAKHVAGCETALQHSGDSIWHPFFGRHLMVAAILKLEHDAGSLYSAIWAEQLPHWPLSFTFCQMLTYLFAFQDSE